MAGEEVVDEGRSGSRKSRDEDEPRVGTCRDLGMPLEAASDGDLDGERRDERVRGNLDPRGGQPRLACDRRGQGLEGVEMLEGLVAPGARARPRGLDELLDADKAGGGNGHGVGALVAVTTWLSSPSPGHDTVIRSPAWQ